MLMPRRRAGTARGAAGTGPSRTPLCAWPAYSVGRPPEPAGPPGELTFGREHCPGQVGWQPGQPGPTLLEGLFGSWAWLAAGLAAERTLAAAQARCGGGSSSSSGGGAGDRGQRYFLSKEEKPCGGCKAQTCLGRQRRGPGSLGTAAPRLQKGYRRLPLAATPFAQRLAGALEKTLSPFGEVTKRCMAVWLQLSLSSRSMSLVISICS
jgi:hypothetical protein